MHAKYSLTHIHPITNTCLQTPFFIFVCSYVFNTVIIENTDDISQLLNNISDLLIIKNKIKKLKKKSLRWVNSCLWSDSGSIDRFPSFHLISYTYVYFFFHFIISNFFPNIFFSALYFTRHPAGKKPLHYLYRMISYSI